MEPGEEILQSLFRKASSPANLFNPTVQQAILARHADYDTYTKKTLNERIFLIILKNSAIGTVRQQ